MPKKKKTKTHHQWRSTSGSGAGTGHGNISASSTSHPARGNDGRLGSGGAIGGEAAEDLSQAEIWDDRMLVKSWEEAVKEYEYYHSLAAKGLDPETLNAFLDEAEDADASGDTIPLALEAGQGRFGNGSEMPDAEGGGDGEDEGDIEEGEIDEEVHVQAEGGELEDFLSEPQSGISDLNQSIGAKIVSTTPKNRAHGKHHGPELPNSQNLAHPAQTQPTQAQAQTQGQTTGTDGTLENLKMAYYWAGYYSGLYDGQRQVVTTSGDGEPSNAEIGNGKIG